MVTNPSYILSCKRCDDRRSILVPNRDSSRSNVCDVGILVVFPCPVALFRSVLIVRVLISRKRWQMLIEYLDRI